MKKRRLADDSGARQAQASLSSSKSEHISVHTDVNLRKGAIDPLNHAESRMASLSWVADRRGLMRAEGSESEERHRTRCFNLARRRASSHKRFAGTAEQQIKNEGKAFISRASSRRFGFDRRRPERRDAPPDPTRKWLAKRTKKSVSWDQVLEVQSASDRGPSALLRASATDVFLHDASKSVTWLHVEGHAALSRVLDPDFSPSSSLRRSLILYEPDSFPSEAVGPIALLRGDGNADDWWVGLHRSLFERARGVLIQAGAKLLESTSSSSSSETVSCTFQLYGPQSADVLNKVFGWKIGLSDLSSSKVRLETIPISSPAPQRREGGFSGETCESTQDLAKSFFETSTQFKFAGACEVDSLTLSSRSQGLPWWENNLRLGLVKREGSRSQALGAGIDVLVLSTTSVSDVHALWLHLARFANQKVAGAKDLEELATSWGQVSFPRDYPDCVEPFLRYWRFRVDAAESRFASRPPSKRGEREMSFRLSPHMSTDQFTLLRGWEHAKFLLEDAEDEPEIPEELYVQLRLSAPRLLPSGVRRVRPTDELFLPTSDHYRGFLKRAPAGNVGSLEAEGFVTSFSESRGIGFMRARAFRALVEAAKREGRHRTASRLVAVYAGSNEEQGGYLLVSLMTEES